MNNEHDETHVKKPENEKEDFFDKPENVKLILRVFYALSGLLVLVDFFYHRHIDHGHGPCEHDQHGQANARIERREDGEMRRRARPGSRQHESPRRQEAGHRREDQRQQ